MSDDFERGVSIGKAMESVEGCICRGNWRAIIKETEPLIEKNFVDEQGREFNLFGIVSGGDDFYYGMWSKQHGMLLLSCVGSLEGHGFTLRRGG